MMTRLVRLPILGLGALVVHTSTHPVAGQIPARESAVAATVSRGLSAGDRLPLAPLQTITFTVNEGTAMSVDVSPDGTLLTFDLLGQIFTVPISGGQARQLTAGPAFAARPWFSPDGRFLLFRSDLGGSEAAWRVSVVGGIPELDPSGGALRSPPQRRADTLFAPGDRFGAVIERGAAAPRDSARFRVIDRNTRRIVSTAGPPECRSHSSFVATPDGRAFITVCGGKLRRLDLVKGTFTVVPFTATVQLQVRPLVRFPHRVPEDSVVVARRIEYPRISPSGHHVVFGAFNRLWLMALPNGTPRRLTSLDVEEFEPVWSPDGQYIAFGTWTDKAQTDGAIYRVRVVDPMKPSAPERLTHEEGYYSNLTYTAKGHRLVAVRWTRGLRKRGPQPDDWASDAHLIWMPAAGGIITTAPLPPQMCFTSGGGLQTTTSDQSVVLTTQSKSNISNTDTLALTMVTFASRSDSSALAVGPAARLRIEIPKIKWGACHTILLASTGNRALVYSQDSLYLMEVPVASSDSAPMITLDLRTPRTRRLTASLAEGAEFPAWAPDGQSFTYTFGRTLYRYDMPKADSLVRDSIARAGTPRAATGPVYRPAAFPIAVALPRDRPNGTIVFRHARLITMHGNTVIERGDLVVRDRRIVALGPSGTVTIPGGAYVVDATGRTIMPGLVDVHNHFFVNMREGIRPERVWQFEANLTYGVLNSRDPQSRPLDFLTYEDRLATGMMLGPRVWGTGPSIGSEPTELTIEGLDDARVVVRKYADVYQVGYLKEYDWRRRDWRQWLVMAAAERKLNVTAHGLPFRDHPRLVQDAIDGFGGYEHQYYEWPLYADMRQLLARTGITLAHHSGGWQGEMAQFPVAYLLRLLDSAALARVQRWWTPKDSSDFYGLSADRASYPIHWAATAAVAQLAADGGRVAVGAHGDSPGYGTHLAIWHLVEGGMPPLEALRSATLKGAEVLGVDRDLGSLEVGKLADLLVLDGNPLERIQRTADVELVLFNGRLYDALTLHEQWPRLRSSSLGETQP